MLIYHNHKAVTAGITADVTAGTTADVTAGTTANAPTGALQKLLLIVCHHTVEERPSKCRKVCVTLACMMT